MHRLCNHHYQIESYSQISFNHFVLHFTKILYYSTSTTVAYFLNIYDCELFQSIRLFLFQKVCIFTFSVSKIQQHALKIFSFPSKIIQNIGYKFSYPMVFFCWYSHNLYAATGDSGKLLTQYDFLLMLLNRFQ